MLMTDAQFCSFSVNEHATIVYISSPEVSDEFGKSFTDFPNDFMILIGFILYVLYFYDVILSYFLHYNWITLKMSEQPRQDD